MKVASDSGDIYFDCYQHESTEFKETPGILLRPSKETRTASQLGHPCWHKSHHWCLPLELQSVFDVGFRMMSAPWVLMFPVRKRGKEQGRGLLLFEASVALLKPRTGDACWKLRHAVISSKGFSTIAVMPIKTRAWSVPRPIQHCSLNKTSWHTEYFPGEIWVVFPAFVLDSSKFLNVNIA